MKNNNKKKWKAVCYNFAHCFKGYNRSIYRVNKVTTIYLVDREHCNFHIYKAHRCPLDLYEGHQASVYSLLGIEQAQ